LEASKDKEKVLIFGAAGFIGSFFLFNLLKNSRYSCLPVFHKTLPPHYRGQHLSADITELGAIENLIKSENPQVLINFAACQTVPSELDPPLADLLNHHIPEKIARLCAHSIRHIHLSTDMVFDGSKSENYSLNDDPDSKGMYGKTKAAGEKAVLKASGNSVIIRTALVMGIHEANSGGFLSWMKNTRKEGNAIPLFSDQYRTPVALEDVSQGIELLMDSSFTGMLQLAGDTKVDRVRMGNWLFHNDEAGRKLIKPTKIGDVQSKFPLQKDLSMDNAEFKKVTGLSLRNLENYIKSFSS